MHRSRTEDILGLDAKQQWERDRQIVLAQLHNLMLALRSNTKFSSKLRFVQAAMEPQHHLMVLVKNLRESLFSPQMEQLPEEDILKPFCEVALSEETTEPITGVALAAFVTFLDLKCSFLTKASLIRLSDCASNSRSEIADAQSHEAVLARILQVYVGCARHPAAQDLEEGHIIGMLERAYAVSTHGDPSELLRRTAEQAMNDIVTAAFYRIVEECAESGGGLEGTQVYAASSGDLLAATPPPPSHKRIGSPTERDEGSSHIRSGASIIQYICKLIMCRVSLPSSQQSAAVSVAAVQLQGLCLAHTALFILKDALRLPACLPLLRFVRNDLCRSLLSIGTRTDNIIVLSQLLRTAHLVVQFASVTVVPQALSIIKGIHLTPMLATLDGPRTGTGRTPLTGPANNASFASSGSPLSLDEIETREMHEMLIESLLEFCSHHSFGTFCFVHYDLSLHYPPLLEQLAHFLARNCFHNQRGGTAASFPSIAHHSASPSRSSSASPSGSSPTGVIPATGNASTSAAVASSSLRINQINILAFDSLMGLLMSLAERAADGEGTTRGSDAIHAAIQAKLQHKRNIMSFVEKFGREPLKEGVRSFIDAHPTPATLTGWEVGEFLFEHRSVLDKNVLGEFLGELGKEPVKPDAADTEATQTWEAARVDDHKKPGTVRWFERQLRGFLNGFQFENKELLTSIREMVFQMRLPGEAQKIDRVMQAFAEHWYACNKNSAPEINPFRSEDAAFILSFSIIMLNTDLHSGKLEKNLTVEGFRSMNRGIDNGQNVPDAYLDVVFEAVRGEQIIMIDMVREGHAYDSVWKMEMAEAKQQAHDSLLVVGMRGNSAPDLKPFDPFVFRTLWRPVLMGLMSVFEGCSAQFTLDGKSPISDASELHAYLKKRYGKDFAVFDCAVRGLRTLCDLGSTFQVPEAVDHAVLSLLRQVPLSLQNGYSNLQMLGRSPSTLIAIQELFRLIFAHPSAIQDAWRDVATFLHQAFLMGLFSRNWGLPNTSAGGPSTPAALDASVASADSVDLSSSIGNRTYSEAISDQTEAVDGISHVLLCNPGIIGPQSARLQWQQAEANGSWFGGWFSSSSQNESKRKEREVEDTATLHRIAHTFPMIQIVLDTAAGMPDHSFVALVEALCHSACTVGDSPVEGYAASYALHFTLEVVLRDHRRMPLVETIVFDHIRQQLEHVYSKYEAALEASHQAAQSSQSLASAGRATDSQTATTSATATRAVTTMEHWKGSAARMTDAVLRMVCMLSKHPRHHATMLQLLAIMVELPPGIFTSVVAQPMSVALYMCVVERSEAEGVLTFSSADAWNQFLYVIHVVGVMAPFAEVRARMVAVLLSITKFGAYDVIANSQRLAHALIGHALAPAIVSQEIPQDWMSINSFDATPYVSVQTPLRSTKDLLDLRVLEESIPEGLVVVYKRLVGLCRTGKPWEQQHSVASTPSSSSPTGGVSGSLSSSSPWYAAWMFILSGFVTLVISARQPRVASDALLCLQRCVLDSDLLCLPLPAVLELFYQLIFPLTEQLCVTTLESSHTSSPSADASSTTPSRSTASAVASTALSLLSPSVLMSTMFGPLAGPGASRHHSHNPETSTIVASGTNSLRTSEEVQCRAISLLPKVFLHYLYILVQAVPQQSPSGAPVSDLELLWKKLLGTLYAMFTATTINLQHHASKKQQHDDAGMLREAIQENVKNLIYVLTATVQVSEHSGLLAKHPYFWATTIELLKPFDFSDALVQHLKTSGFV
ncbi:Sec7 guanine-nucleotide exchange factor, putative [Bodo saltans]|uniref:Sec7 guanine-nucleotide exchange factor, putative n=1 Tax=Bodo saltans TaxID=75058 RepID=A0A0S4INU1_BODSA|nr:Sec7 guanine-nucleotide exchange factor, putative [Bodo saltans]|eukprot:CUE86685.1 Sec7 guanine-nucleotide exchange factor, putative [Bodo saltans]